MFANGETNLLGFSSQSFLFLIIILIYTGINSLLRYIFLFFIASSFLFISKVNEAMGTLGSIYIICAFISFAFQIYTNILPKINFNQKDYFGGKKIRQSI